MSNTQHQPHYLRPKKSIALRTLNLSAKPHFSVIIKESSSFKVEIKSADGREELTWGDHQLVSNRLANACLFTARGIITRPFLRFTKLTERETKHKNKRKFDFSLR